MDDAESPPDFDVFYQYDSTATTLDDNLLKIKVPSAGFYYISLSGIYVTFPTGVTAPVGSAFLSIEKLDSINNGTCVSGSPKQSNKVVFPLINPEVDRPTCKVYNRVLLSNEDSLTFNYYDSAFTKLATSRVIATIHISNNPDIIRITI